MLNYKFDMDVLEWANKAIIKLKYEKVGNLEPVSRPVQFFSIIRNTIPSIPRKIEVANDFSVPKENEEGYKILVTEILQGTDLSPRGSRQQRQPTGYLDSMLLDWNIYHLHLGLNKIKNGKSKGLIQGGKEILFVYFNDDYAYIIGIFDHSAWCKREVLEIIKDNWPHLLKPFEIDLMDFEGDVEEDDHLKMRKAKINVPIKIGNSLYFGPGGGYAMSGHGQQEVHKALLVMRTANHLNSVISKYSDQLEAIYLSNKGNLDDLRLKFDVNEFVFSGKVAVILSSNKQQKVYLPYEETKPLIHSSYRAILEPNKQNFEYLNV